MTIGQLIRQQREALGWSKRELARRIDRTDVSVLFWERDDHVPHPRTRRLLEEALGLGEGSLDGKWPVTQSATGHNQESGDRHATANE